MEDLARSFTRAMIPPDRICKTDGSDNQKSRTKGYFGDASPVGSVLTVFCLCSFTDECHLFGSTLS